MHPLATEVDLEVVVDIAAHLGGPYGVIYVEKVEAYQELATLVVQRVAAGEEKIYQIYFSEN